MNQTKQVTIKINKEKFIIEQNEFWYFRNMLKNISDYYNIRSNRGKIILLKIPGTGKFRQINYSIFNTLLTQINNVMNNYKHELQVL